MSDPFIETESFLEAAPRADPEALFTHRVTVTLDAIAALGIAAGITWGLWPLLGAFGLAVGGIVLSVLVYLADLMREVRAKLAEPGGG